MPDLKPLRHSLATESFTSFIRERDAEAATLPRMPVASFAEEMRMDAAGFLEDWSLRHFAISVHLHDVARVSEGDAERGEVLDDLAEVQGILLELHDYASHERAVREVMVRSERIQNGVAALYAWLDEVLDVAARLRVTRGRPGFVDGLGEDAFPAIVRALERVHPDLESLVQIDGLDLDYDVAQKLSLCFRQIGAVVVRVSGRSALSTVPPPRF
ncbi:MAG TPA: hypothetical protein VGI39_08340 [Polyangiaceae bacterium]|jgi:hypothetical protein